MSNNMRVAEKFMKQFAVYWEHHGNDDSGQPLFDPPIEIKCRWDDVHEVFLDLNGNDQVTNAKVMVDRDVVVQGQLWLGRLQDLTSQSVPIENQGAYAIRRFEKTVDKKGKKFVRMALL